MPTKRQWAGPKRQNEAVFPADMSQVDRRSIVRVLVEENPKVERSHSRERFAFYRDGMTVADYIVAVVNSGDKEQVALDDLAWDQNRSFIRIDAPSSSQAWSVAEAKAKLSEILRLARAGEPQIIGSEEPCVVVSADQFERLWQPRHLGRFLIETAPRGAELELPPRGSDRPDPFPDL
jgi:prevent-host-death family protein